MKAVNYRTRALNSGMLLLIYILIAVYSCVYGQSFQRITHTGIEVSYGLHGFKTPSNEYGAEKVRVLTRGAAIGFITGNNLMKVRVRPFGYYTSTAVEKRKFTIVESEALVNLYPLEFFRTSKHVLDIYVTMGVKVNQYKYSDRNDYIDLTTTPEAGMPVDKVSVISQQSGVGIIYRLPYKNFVHVFTEVLFSNPIYSNTSNEQFSQTLKQSGTAVNIGVRIGTKRTVKTGKYYPG